MTSATSSHMHPHLAPRPGEDLLTGLRRNADSVTAVRNSSDSPGDQQRFETQWRMEAYAMTTAASIPHRIHIP